MATRKPNSTNKTKADAQADTRTIRANDLSGAAAAAARQLTARQLTANAAAAAKALTDFRVETEEALRTAACTAIDVYLAAKQYDENESNDGSINSDEYADCPIGDLRDAALEAIRRTALSGSDRHYTGEELERLFPECSFYHKGLNRIFVATTGLHLGEIVPPNWQTYEHRTLISVPAPAL